MNYSNKLIKFSPNRVWRTYTGGKILDQLENKAEPADTHFPEDWIGSTTRAVNPDREHIHEGISEALIGDEKIAFDELLKIDPAYFLGDAHIHKFGNNPMLLVKFLDSSVRLHFQAHPSAEFARERLNSNHGKAEGYYILQVREGIENPYVYVGFQHPPAREDFKKMIEDQDIDAIERCFEKVPVKEGDCLFIPGGAPHAIGEGILMVEIMEPSDWAVRFEFTKAGYTMPVEARFMKRDLDFCMDVFDFTALSVEQAIAKFRHQPKREREFNEHSFQDSLIDETITDKFRVKRSTLKGKLEKSESDFYIGIVTRGECTVTIDGEQTELKMFDRFFCPAGIESITVESADGVEILECFPPAAV
ncbi:class I mannose-6-phosphate isomerase [Reinekea marinisedimentorum]|uniref:Mannose-6-phosphate isomerase n=1 Tax=Reinekea marinisedimentorum TaxID=230495 RepID=A0A4R3IAL2_9GAMM|nr:class I mannose-6-phosphate isomerase [Reinekea marinisedimentorum]TCS43014.1 mannose-6-phosphate isomerase [Reinekea marinisedimentorum]